MDPPEPADPDTTEALLRRLAEQPEASWTALLRRVETKLRVLLHFRMSERLRAVVEEEDLLQETWAEAAHKLERFEYRGPGSLQRWMAGILRNKLLHAARGAPRVPLPMSALPNHVSSSSAAAALFDALHKTQPGVADRVLREEAAAKVREVLARLPATEREAVLLRVFEGCTGREAAEREGVDESTISLRLQRALAACSRHLAELA
ncbi:MAG: RNA polymerase sigma factor [Planctomycetota bacterium]|nr:MAG: RNA polymerase sigma factor [Planctomycetota bacterium]